MKIMFSLHERSLCGGIFYRMSKFCPVQKFSHFKICKFDRISYREGVKNGIRYLILLFYEPIEAIFDILKIEEFISILHKSDS